MQNADWDALCARAADLLASNRQEVDGHRYTAPASGAGTPGVYANQALWDSCFHAIIWRWLDPDMARDELLSLVSRQVSSGPDAGMIPHMNYWRGGARHHWATDTHSQITQPPLIAVAARLVYDVSGDRSLLEGVYEPVCAFHEWFDRRRDPDGDRLVCLIHPWESGWDASPRWDHALGLENPTHDEARAARLALPAHLIAHDFDAAALAGAGSYCVEPVDFNAIRAADLDALAGIAHILGWEGEAIRWAQRATAVRDAIQARMFDGLPYDLEGPGEKPIRQESAAQYITLFAGAATVEQAARLVDQLRQDRHWPAYPVPTTPVDAPTFAPDRYWRGNVWLNVNWLIYQGLRRYGYDDVAGTLAARSLALVEQSGCWEYYHPLTGQGLGSPHYSWSAIVVDMLASERARGQ